MLTGLTAGLPFLGLAIAVWILWERGIGPHHIDLSAGLMRICEHLGPRLGNRHPLAHPGSPPPVTAMTSHGYADFEGVDRKGAFPPATRKTYDRAGNALARAGSPAPPHDAPDPFPEPRCPMPIPQMLNVYRHDRANRVLITLAGEIDLESAPLVRESLGQCLREGIRTIDVDLTTVTFCDCSGLNAFLAASRHTAAAGGTLRLHHPPATLVRLFTLTGTGSLLGLPAASGFSVRPDKPAGAAPAVRPSGSGETAPRLAPVAADASGGVL